MENDNKGLSREMLKNISYYFLIVHSFLLSFQFFLSSYNFPSLFLFHFFFNLTATLVDRSLSKSLRLLLIKTRLIGNVPQGILLHAQTTTTAADGSLTASENVETTFHE